MQQGNSSAAVPSSVSAVAFDSGSGICLVCGALLESWSPCSVGVQSRGGARSRSWIVASEAMGDGVADTERDNNVVILSGKESSERDK
jgi:hypothetical protein